MKNEREIKFEQISKRIDELSDDELDFATWILLQRLIEKYKTEKEKVEDKEWKDVLYIKYLEEHIKSMDTIRQALTYQLW